MNIYNYKKKTLKKLIIIITLQTIFLIFNLPKKYTQIQTIYWLKLSSIMSTLLRVWLASIRNQAVAYHRVPLGMEHPNQEHPGSVQLCK